MIKVIDSFKDIDFEISYDISSYKENPYVKYLFYFIDSKVVAYLVYEDIYDRFEIDFIFVDNKYRRRGIASNLLDELFKVGKEKNIINITLEVRKDNYSAISLYLKHGFVSKAIREKYYSGIDGILMEKEMM